MSTPCIQASCQIENECYSPCYSSETVHYWRGWTAQLQSRTGHAPRVAASGAAPPAAQAPHA